MSPVRVVVLDDHPLVATGIFSVLQQHDPSLTLAHASTSWPALEQQLAAGLRPDIALVDLVRRDGTRPEAAVDGLVRLGIPVVVITSELRPVPLRRAVAAGATGLFLKSDPPERLVDILRAALAGETDTSSELAFVLISDPDLHAHLAPREIEALTLLSEGWPRGALGARMHPPVSSSTAITYINRAIARYRELGRNVPGSADAVREAIADGYLDPPDRKPDPP